MERSTSTRHAYNRLRDQSYFDHPGYQNADDDVADLAKNDILQIDDISHRTVSQPHLQSQFLSPPMHISHRLLPCATVPAVDSTTATCFSSYESPSQSRHAFADREVLPDNWTSHCQSYEKSQGLIVPNPDDTDVLSLYEYNTFLENEDATDEYSTQFLPASSGTVREQNGLNSNQSHTHNYDRASTSVRYHEQLHMKLKQMRHGPASTRLPHTESQAARKRSWQSVESVDPYPETLQTPWLQEKNLRLEREIVELEAELKHFIQTKNIPLAAETVGKILKMGPVKIDQMLVFSLLHLFIREGSVSHLMKILTFVCSQDLFNEEVCDAYIRLGCSDSRKFDEQLKNIFQHLQRHGLHSSGDCLIALLSVYSEHRGDPKLFWLILSYFETLPGFATPVPLLENALTKLLQHKDKEALDRFNRWVQATKTDAIQKVDLALIGKIAAHLTPHSLRCMQKLLADSQEENLMEKRLPAEEETVFVIPQCFSDQDLEYWHGCIESCGASMGWQGMSELFLQLCGRPGGNRPLLSKYATVLLQTDSVLEIDKFLRRLHLLHQQELAKGTLLDLDRLALAHLASIFLQYFYLNHHVEVTLNLLDVIISCPVVSKKLLVNCGDIGQKMLTVCLKCQKPLKALNILTEMRLGKADQQELALLRSLLQQLVLARDVNNAFSALSIAASRGSVGVAELGSLSSQLLWRAFNLGNVGVTVDLLDLCQSQNCPLLTLLPATVLRAELVACSLAGYVERTDPLFELLKAHKVYNAQLLQQYPYIVQLSTMLTPTEMRFCIQDRLKELYHKLCDIVAYGGVLSPMDRGFAVRILPEHDPELLALPFLALAPRSSEQAIHVVTNILSAFSPPLQARFTEEADLVIIDPASLVSYLKDYDSACLKQGLHWDDEASLLFDSSVIFKESHIPGLPSSWLQFPHTGTSEQSQPPSAATAPCQDTGFTLQKPFTSPQMPLQLTRDLSWIGKDLPYIHPRPKRAKRKLKKPKSILVESASQRQSRYSLQISVN